MGGRGLSAGVLAGLRAQDVVAKYAVEINWSAVKRYCTGDISVKIDSNIYTCREFRISGRSVSGPSDSRLQIEIDNADGEITASAMANTSGTVGVTVWILLRDGPSWLEVSEEDWTVEGVSGSLRSVRLDLRGTSGLRSQPGLSVGSAQCTIRKFKGARCQYASADTSCKRTWADCTSKSNTTHFRGFRDAPEGGETLKIGTGNGVVVSAPAEIPPQSGVYTTSPTREDQPDRPTREG